MWRLLLVVLLVATGCTGGLSDDDESSDRRELGAGIFADSMFDYEDADGNELLPCEFDSGFDSEIEGVVVERTGQPVRLLIALNERGHILEVYPNPPPGVIEVPSGTYIVHVFGGGSVITIADVGARFNTPLQCGGIA